jgi:hypothetical protein
MKKKSRVLKDILIDYVRLYYLGVLNDREIKNAISIFELLLDDEVNVEDFIPIIRQMQFDLDTVLA